MTSTTARLCCLCRGPLDPDAADHTGLAHADCAAREYEDIRCQDVAFDDDSDYRYTPSRYDWEEYAYAFDAFDADDPCEF